MASNSHELKLNRKLQNHAFNSWRLGGDNSTAGTRTQIDLPHPVFLPPSTGPQDFLHVREALLHNNLDRTGGNCFLGLNEPQGFTIHHLCATARDEGVDVTLERVAGPLPSPGDDKAQDAALNYSIAVVEAAESDAPQLLLFSSGRGDLQACELATDQAGSSVSPPLYPFPQSEAGGNRQFVVEAAYATPTGSIRAVVWLITPRPGSKHASCEMYLLTLSHTSTADTRTLELVSSHILYRSHLPPHATLVHPPSDTVLLAVEPAGHEDDDMVVQQPGAAGVVDDDEEEGDVDPRNLKEAAARLDKFTTEHTVGPDSKAVWDVNHEDGGDTVGEVGSEPSCELLYFRCTAEGSQGPTRTWSMSFGAHKVLSVQQTSSRSCLLGVTDDVDCALIRIQLQDDTQEPAVVHEAFAPALAYVITGKVQRRHVLLGGLDGAASAVIVESQKYCYMYRQVDRRAEFGEQQVFDMQLEGDEAILGAQLFNGPEGVQVLLLLTKTKLIAYKLV